MEIKDSICIYFSCEGDLVVGFRFKLNFSIGLGLFVVYGVGFIMYLKREYDSDISKYKVLYYFNVFKEEIMVNVG